MKNPKARKTFLSLAMAVACAALLLPFQNCARIPAFATGASTSSENPAPTRAAIDSLPESFSSEREAAAAPFRNAKVSWSAEGVRAFGKTGGLLSAGTRLIAILDNECLRSVPSPIAARIDDLAAQAFPSLRTQSYVLKLREPLASSVLEAEAAGDACLIGLSNDGVLRTGAAPADPLLPKQTNYIAVGGPVSHTFFKDPLRGATAAVVVAVIDTGIAYNHEDLKNSLWTNGAGEYGRNVLDDSPNVFDSFGHGTLVSGIIGAKSDNGLGIAGVMGHDLKLMTLKVSGSDGSAMISTITAAVNLARDKGVDVINISMEGTGDNPGLQSALNSAVSSGVFIAVAAGNDNIQIAPSGSQYIVPAIYGSGINGMMTVGSVDAVTGARSWFSNYDSNYVEIAAPGSNGVYSTDRAGSYSSTEGTSFSSPMVAGAAALTISFFKKNGIAYNPATIEATLKAAAVKRGSLSGAFNQGAVLDLESLAGYLRRAYLAPVDGGFDED